MSLSLGANGGSYNYPETGDQTWGNNATNFASAVSAALTKLGLGSALTADAVIDIVSTTKGILIPRMTTTQRDAIATPSTGLMIYNTSTSKFNIYYSGAWNSIASEAFVAGLINNSPNWASPSTSTAPSESATATRFVKQDAGLYKPPYLCVVDEKSTGTDGGTFTSGAWRTRDLNTTRANTITGASIGSNQITLPAGTFRIQATAPAAQGPATDFAKARLYNITDAATVIVGTTSVIGVAGSTGQSQERSLIVGRFTIASQKVFEIQHQISSSASTNGFGHASGFSEVEVYTVVEIYQEV